MLYHNKEPCVFPCQEGWHRPALSLFAKAFIVFSCKLPKVAYFQKFACIAIEDEYGNTPAQRAELDWLLYNKPLEYAQMVLRGETEHYLSLGCDHGWLED